MNALQKRLAEYQAGAPMPSYAELVEIANTAPDTAALQARIAELLNQLAAYEHETPLMRGDIMGLKKKNIELEAMVAAQAGQSRAAIVQALRQYRLSNALCSDGEGNYPLVDLLTPDGESIGDGWNEIELIADAIIEAAPPAPASLSLVSAALEAAKQAVKDRAVSDEIFVENAVDAIHAIDPQAIIDEVGK